MSAIIRVADSFLNVRGSFKIGPIDIKTHTSLVQRKNGNWLMLDSLKMADTVKQEVDEVTQGGKTLDAILNLHPFHTVWHSTLTYCCASAIHTEKASFPSTGPRHMARRAHAHGRQQENAA